MKVNKSPGPNQSHQRLLKGMSAYKNFSLYGWTKAKSLIHGRLVKLRLCSIRKEKSDPSNYWPTSVVCKTKKIRSYETMQHLLVSEVLSRHQHAWVYGRKIMQSSVAGGDIWSRLLDEGDNNVDMVYLDFAKAFGTVPHKRMMNKLYYYTGCGK